jgi:hypothetical protein
MTLVWLIRQAWYENFVRNPEAKHGVWCDDVAGPPIRTEEHQGNSIRRTWVGRPTLCPSEVRESKSITN